MNNTQDFSKKEKELLDWLNSQAMNVVREEETKTVIYKMLNEHEFARGSGN